MTKEELIAALEPEPSPVRPIEQLGAWCGNYHVLSCNLDTMTATVDAIRLDPEGGEKV